MYVLLFVPLVRLLVLLPRNWKSKSKCEAASFKGRFEFININCLQACRFCQFPPLILLQP